MLKLKKLEKALKDVAMDLVQYVLPSNLDDLVIDTSMEFSTGTIHLTNTIEDFNLEYTRDAIGDYLTFGRGDSFDELFPTIAGIAVHGSELQMYRDNETGVIELFFYLRCKQSLIITEKEMTAAGINFKASFAFLDKLSKEVNR